MKTQPNRETFIALRKNSERVPVLREKTVKQFDPPRFFRLMFGKASNAFLFESGKGPAATSRYTFMGQSNLKTLQADNHQVTVANNGTRTVTPDSPLSILDYLQLESKGASFDYAPHFWGGWIGLIGYEMAQWLDTLCLRSKDDLGLPLLHFFQVDRLWVYDHSTQVLKMVISEEGLEDVNRHYNTLLEEMEQHWEQAGSFMDLPRQPGTSSSPVNSGNNEMELQSNISESQYISMVEKAKHYIEEGDIYQANLAQRFKTSFQGDAFGLYEELRRINPSPFSGYLKLGDLTLVSSSPERLVKIEKGVLETRPIAGTRPRGRSQEEDQHLTAELLLNEKEQAEHLMLVDLERNDLGRICNYGSVQVTDQMFVEQYSHVSHIVSNIRGILKPGTTLSDILKAVFPGGTITGCPKIRCMEIIDELEPVARGPYSGSFGYIGFGGTLDLNIIIRTILLKEGKAYFHVGAGIVADSIPEKEYQETLDKAGAMIDVLSGKHHS